MDDADGDGDPSADGSDDRPGADPDGAGSDGAGSDDTPDVRAAKRRAGRRAARQVEDGQVVGLGTGSTAVHAVEELGRRADEGLSVRGVATSLQSRRAALAAGLRVVDLDEVDRIDVAIDGADQVAGAHLLKGGGGAHAREKVVDAFADRLLVVVDPRKVVATLDGPVPVAVLPAARTTVARRIEAWGGDPELRTAEHKDGPVVTDDGHLVVDCDLGRIDDPAATAARLSGLPGVVEHGLFVDAADRVFVGREDGVDVRTPGEDPCP